MSRIVSPLAFISFLSIASLCVGYNGQLKFIRMSMSAEGGSASSRRSFVTNVFGTVAITALTTTYSSPDAHAIGPVKLSLLNPVYSARPCPKDKPIPGEKAMKGMRGLVSQLWQLSDNWIPRGFLLKIVKKNISLCVLRVIPWHSYIYCNMCEPLDVFAAR